MKKWLVVLGCLSGLIGSILAAVGTIFSVKIWKTVKLMGGANGPASIFSTGTPGFALSIALTLAGIILVGVMVVCLLKS